MAINEIPEARVPVDARHYERVVRWLKEHSTVLVYENRDPQSPLLGKHRHFVRFDPGRHGDVPKIGSRIRFDWCKEGEPWQYLLVGIITDIAKIVKV